MTIHPFSTDQEVIKFARSWMWSMSGFVRKNIRCCLTSTERDETAWFPALMESCAYLDLLASLHSGHRKVSLADVQSYANRFLNRSHYPAYELEILWTGFRHKIAHQAHPYYVLDTKTENISGPHRRFVWTVDDADLKPALNTINVGRVPTLTSTRPMVPWPVPYDHRIIISPVRLQIDLRNSLYGPRGYLNWLEGNRTGRENFVKGMLRFFPR